MTSPSPSADLSKLRINRDAPPPEVRRALGTPALLLSGLAFALVMGLVGGFFPARRAARLPVVQALR